MQVRVELGARSYQIIIGSGVIKRLGELLRAAVPAADRILVMADAAVADVWLPPAVRAIEEQGLPVHTVVAPAGEACKTLAVAANMFEACLDAGLERGSCIVALGGGAVGDLAGFIAATYLRGIAFVQMPTTLLAQVDASVGGKVAVNLPRGKNLVGAFHQPRLVLSDIDTLGTLPQREFRSGLAEVVKHGLIRDRNLFADLEQNAGGVLQQGADLLASMIERNCRIKAAVVGADEREGGLRAILNLGHTVGHAVEALAGRMGEGSAGLLHGEAVSIGLVAAARLSERLGVLAQPDLPARVEALLQRFHLPVRLPPAAVPADLPAVMARDKKVAAGQIKWVLPVRIGQVQVTNHVPAGEVSAVLADLTAET